MKQRDLEGAQAYVYLESLVGKTIDPDRALHNWMNMQPKDQTLTMRMAQVYRRRFSAAREKQRKAGSVIQ